MLLKQLDGWGILIYMSREREQEKNSELKQFWYCDNCGVVSEVVSKVVNVEGDLSGQFALVIKAHQYESPACVAGQDHLQIISIASLLDKEFPHGVGKKIAEILKLA